MGESDGRSHVGVDRGNAGDGAPPSSGQTTLTVPTEALSTLVRALVRQYHSVAPDDYDRSLTALLLMRVEQAMGEEK